MVLRYLWIKMIRNIQLFTYGVIKWSIFSRLFIRQKRIRYTDRNRNEDATAGLQDTKIVDVRARDLEVDSLD